MTHRFAFPRLRILRDLSGATLIEFAIVAPILFLMILAIIEIGMIMLAQSVIESATATTTRTARIGNDGGTGNLEQFIREEIVRSAGGLLDAEKIIITTDPRDYVDIPPAEQCLIQSCAVDRPLAANVDYADTNGNNQFDQPELVFSGDFLFISVHYPYEVLTPIVGSLFADANGEYVITSRSLVVNEDANLSGGS